MEFFTLKKDSLEIESKKRKKILTKVLPLILLFLLVFLRGYDFFTIEHHKAYFTGKYSNDKELIDLRDNGTKLTKSNTNSNGTFENENRNLDYGISLTFSKNNQLDKYKDISKKDSFLTTKLKQKLLEQNYNSKSFDFSFETNENYLSVEKLNLNGFYWIPLLKKGKVDYILDIAYTDSNTTVGFNRDKYFGRFTGDIDFEVYGICSIDKLKKQLSDIIVSNILAEIEKDFKEYK